MMEDLRSVDEIDLNRRNRRNRVLEEEEIVYIVQFNLIIVCHLIQLQL